LYARALLPSLPLAGRLPWLGTQSRGRPGDSMSDLAGSLERRRTGVRVDRGNQASYGRLTGHRLGDALPGLYPHVLAFEMHLRLLVDRRFPFEPLGLVHVANAATVHRPISAAEPLDLVCRTSGVRGHPRGRLVDVETAVFVDGETVWEETTTLLSRGDGDREAPDGPPLAGADAPVGSIRWDLPADLGRQYAAVSGDRNPIHLYAATAKAFGFPRAIAHGMWTAARTLAHVEGRLPGSYRYDVAFRRPVLLPGRVRVGMTTDEATGALTLGVVSSGGEETHLVARVSPR
jgi:acyl dehydratase